MQSRRAGSPSLFSRRACYRAACATLGLVTGCAPAFEARVVDRGGGVIPAGTGAWARMAATVAVNDAPESQVLRYAVSLPRATRLRYQVACPGAEREGVMGETFAEYGTRRLAELEQERRRQAAAIGAVVGALAPAVAAGASTGGPGGSASVSAQVNPGAVAASAAHGVLPAPVLPAGDTGGRVVRGDVLLGVSGAGRCELSLWPDPPGQDASGTTVALELVRMVDVAAEERGARAAVQAEQDRRAHRVRVAVLSSLQRTGADPQARARAQADRQAREQAATAARERAAEVERERREAETNRRAWEARTRSLALRRLVLAALVRTGADPWLRQRREEARLRIAREEELLREDERQRREEARLRIAREEELLREDERQRREDERQRREDERQRRERQTALARVDAVALRVRLLSRLTAAGADPEYRQRRDEAAMREIEVEARQREQARRETAEREERAAHAAVALRLQTKFQLHQQGAVDRPRCPPTLAERPPPPPVPPSQTRIEGTLVISPGPSLRITVHAR
jgi:hypothetical protein